MRQRHIKRTPPNYVIKVLRSEVGFACPICGSPFLTWHHFDPPWREKKHHKPEGMIALCPEHAAQADGGHWTVLQLRNLKRPLSQNERVVASWPWQPEKAIFMLGNSYYLGERPLLSLGNYSIFKANKQFVEWLDNSVVSFSMNLYSEFGEPILSINDNFLSFRASDLVDVRCPPQARYLEATSKKGDSLKISYKRLHSTEFIEQVPSTTFNKYDTVDKVLKLIQTSALDSEGKVPVIEMTGDLENEEVEMHIRRDKFTLRVKSYNNELVNMPGRFYESLGSLIFKLGEKEIIKFG